MSDKIIDALNKLDPNENAHWTEEGQPQLAVVQQFAGDKNIKRKEITDAAPLFTREKALADLAERNKDPVKTEPVITHPPVELTSEDHLRRLQSELADLAKARADAQIAHEEKRKEIDKFIESGAVRAEKFHETMEGYKRAQQVMRESRHGNAEFLENAKQAGLLETRAPIDQVMRRQSNRFGERPKVGMQA